MNSFDLSTACYEVRRFCWLLVIMLLGGTGLGYLQSKYKPLSFTSEAKMVLSGKISIDAGTSYSDEMGDFMGTQAAIMQGTEVRSRAEKSLGAAGKKPTGPAVISATYIPRTTIFILKAKGNDPVYTEALLQETMRAFIGLRKEIRQQRADEATLALREEVARVRREVEIAAQALNDFQSKFNEASLEDQLNAETAYLATLRKRVADLRMQRSLVATGGSGAPVPTTAGSSIPTGTVNGDGTNGTRQGGDEKLQAVLQDIVMLQAKRERLLTYLRPEHPKIKQISLKIEQMSKLVDFLSTKDRLASIDREFDALNREVSQGETHLMELNNNLAEYRSLKTRSDTSRGAFDKLSANLQSVDVGKQLDQEIIAILENATPASLQKNLAQNVAIGAVFGLILGAGAVYLLARCIPRFQSIAAVKRALGLPVFAKILRDPWMTRKRTVLDCDRHHLAFAESFRNLRSSLLNLPTEFTARKCIAVTSAVPYEGKSTVAVNLAIALAATAAKTLLIDADLRNGNLHQLLKVESGLGLSDLITNQCRLNQALRATAMANLMLLPAGQRIGNIAEHILRYGTEQLFETLTQHFEYVILDTPPILVADDAVTLAAKADWALFVVRLGYSRPMDSQTAIEELTSRQVDVPGVVVNCVPKNLTSQSYYNAYANALENRPFLVLPDKENRPAGTFSSR
jgi:capsular exopolysaccharide synthesis family protein